jgi:hypothetical protein
MQLLWTSLNLDDQILDMVNIYASNNAVEHAPFWRWLVAKLQEAPSLVCGVFNMVDNIEDKEGPLHVQMPQGEKDACFMLKV